VPWESKWERIDNPRRLLTFSNTWDKIRGNQTEGEKGSTDFREGLQRRVHYEERMVSHQRYPNDVMFSGHGDLGTYIEKELLSGEYRGGMGGVTK
jgi:hypothetical protein